ncbi:DMT family transporter [Maritimibacter sp. DP1N21-5]|uniref:DMT family transporter n=1 Tax=Maritimibacter sp. DP1N21-5 TaxID=2836867 RepID=UPI001C43D49E|nr:DMT family transporter [Maritimibacter sp. DP1N21-5]MBV7409104.1 DMT family transporter [Maritimibacter sp. DP1N21-5]
MVVSHDSGTARPVAGVFWMLVTGLLFVIMTAVVKNLGDRLPPAETSFLRYALGLGFLIPMLGPIRAARLDRRTLGIFALRGVAHSAGVILWFYAMTQIPLAEVTAINYLNPVFVTIGAALFFGEALAARRLGAIVAALIGALIILRPGARAIEPGHVAMLATAVFFAVSYLIAGRLAGRVSPAAVVGMLSITVTIGLAPFALMNWVTPTPAELGWLFLVAGVATAGHYTMTLAFAAAPLTVTQPVTFLQLVWSVALGALFFDEGLDPWVIGGGTVIISAVTFITWREAVLKRRVTPSPHQTKG